MAFLRILVPSCQASLSSTVGFPAWLGTRSMLKAMWRYGNTMPLYTTPNALISQPSQLIRSIGSGGASMRLWKHDTDRSLPTNSREGDVLVQCSVALPQRG